MSKKLREHFTGQNKKQYEQTHVHIIGKLGLGGGEEKSHIMFRVMRIKAKKQEIYNLKMLKEKLFVLNSTPNENILDI